jgi:hypothetical protein
MKKVLIVFGVFLVVMSFANSAFAITPTMSLTASYSNGSVTLSVSGRLSSQQVGPQCQEDPSFQVAPYAVDVAKTTVPDNVVTITAGPSSYVNQQIPISIVAGTDGDCFNSHITSSYSGSKTLSTSGLAAGTYNVTVQVVDDFGGSKSVTASFTVPAATTFNVSASLTGSGGAVSPSNQTTSGSAVSVNVNPTSGFYVDTSYNTGTCPRKFPYPSGFSNGNALYTTDSPITQDCTIILQFLHSPLTITPSAGTGCSISPSTAQTVNYGSNSTFNISANSGYQLSDVKVDNVSVGTPSSYTFTNVTANHTISASCTAVASTPVCSATHYNCSTGTSSGTTGDTSALYKWNCTSGGNTVACSEAKPLPDLKASNVTPTNATANVQVTFSSTISNVGTASTGSTFSNFFQVASGAGGGGTVTDLFANSMGALAAGGTGTTTKNYTFSSAGTYSVRACADKTSSVDTGTIYEGANENNNCGAWTNITVSTVAVPVVTISASPISGTAPVTPSLTWSATNSPTSCAASGAWSGAKASSGTSIAQTTLTTAGTYTYTLTCTNSGGTSSPASATVTVSSAPAPDLTAGAVTPTTATVNTATSFSATITNVGTAAASGTITHLFQFDEDTDHTTVNAAQTATTTATLNASGGTASVSSSYTFATTGTKYIRVCADNNASFTGTVSEGTEGEANNCGAWTPVTVSTASFIDLTTSNTSPGAAIVGVSQTYTATITNGGNIATGTSAFPYFFQVSTGPNGTGILYTIASDTTAALAAGASRAVSFSSAATAAGTYYLRACADKADAASVGTIAESDENNNCSPSWSIITVSSSPTIDLVSGAVSPTSVNEGASANFSATISNAGTAATGASFPYFFQAASGAGGTGTITDLTSKTMTALAGGAAGTASQAYTFTDPGTHSMRVCADKTSSAGGGVITESDENNNCGAWTNITAAEDNDPEDNIPSTIGVDNVTISAATVKTDGTHYNISVVGHRKSGGTLLAREYALIDFQGSNAGAYRGFFTWYRLSDAWPTAQDKHACSGVGGYAVIQNQAPNDIYGHQYVHLDSCNVTDGAGGVTTTIFTVHFTPLFTSPATGNDISGLVCDISSCTPWVNFDINFGLDVTAQGEGGVCLTAHYGCATGTSTENVNGSSAWTWKCLGTGGAPTATCTEVKKKPTFEEN